MTTAAPARTRLASTGHLIDTLWALRETKRRLESEADTVAKEMATIEEQLTARMDSEGVVKATGTRATVSFSSNVTAQVEGDDGWTLLYPYIAKHKYWHLLQRRISDPAYRELLEAGKKVPGVQPFVKKRLNLRVVD